MTMDPIAIAALAVSAIGLFYGLRARAKVGTVAAANATLRAVISAQSGQLISQGRKIRNLRDNCFLTNEHGHRVRYWKASEQVRAKAER
jgi:hypothetical protein